MTKQDSMRVILVGASREMTEELEGLLQTAPFELMQTGDVATLMNDPAQLAGTCLIMSNDSGAELQDDGLSLLAKLAVLPDAPASLVLVTDGNVQLAVDAMKAGASDVLAWPNARSELAMAITAAVAKPKPRWPNGAARPRKPADGSLDRLTARERGVLHLLVEGRSNKAVGMELGISERTVEVHRANIMRKLHVGSFAALVRLALEADCAN